MSQQAAMDPSTAFRNISEAHRSLADDYATCAELGVAGTSELLRSISNTLQELVTRVGGLETRLGGLEATVEARFSRLEQRIDALETRMGALDTRMQARYVCHGSEIQAAIADEMVQANSTQSPALTTRKSTT